MLADDYFDVYLISTATVLLAVVVALFVANFFQDENHNEDNQVETSETYEKEKDTSKCDEKSSDALDENPDNNDFDYLQTNAGILGKLKTARWKSLEAQLTEDQLEEERRIGREQLAAIFELLKKQESELNFKEIDETELNAQLNLYR